MSYTYSSKGLFGLIELKGATLLPHQQHTDIMSHEPRECPQCHRMTCFFVNQNGTTTCTACTEAPQ